MPKQVGKRKRWWKVVLIALVGIGGAAFGFVAWTNLAAVHAAKGRLYENPGEVPGGRVGLVFGCDDRIDGRENLYFKYRIEAAAELWKAGKLACVIVSGDNRTKFYNEPETMKRALADHGVPAEKIVCDYAGLRTLDSVVRAAEVFGVEEVTFVSQKFQNERAAYLAKAQGMDYVGFNAEDVAGQSGLRVRLREVAARVKMWLDVRVLGTEPRHLGEKEALPM